VHGDRWRGGGEVAAREEDSEVRTAVGGSAGRRRADGDRDGACRRADAAYASPTVLRGHNLIPKSCEIVSVNAPMPRGCAASRSTQWLSLAIDAY
jgi:hypothetical protein